jgi:hypothetical protein
VAALVSQRVVDHHWAERVAQQQHLLRQGRDIRRVGSRFLGGRLVVEGRSYRVGGRVCVSFGSLSLRFYIRVSGCVGGGCVGDFGGDGPSALLGVESRIG